MASQWCAWIRFTSRLPAVVYGHALHDEAQQRVAFAVSPPPVHADTLVHERVKASVLIGVNGAVYTEALHGTNIWGKERRTVTDKKPILLVYTF